MLQREVARQLGVNQWTYGNWENGDNEPFCRHYPVIIAFLGYEPWPEAVTLPERILAERRRRGLSLVAAAKLIKVDEATLWWWEQGRVPHGGRLEMALLSFLLVGIERTIHRAARIER